MTALRPRTSPWSESFVMMVLPSREEVESFALPAHRMNTPRACCPSMKSMVPLGYTAVDLISFRCCTAGTERLQKRCCSRAGQVVQLSRMFRPYGARIRTSLGSELAANSRCFALPNGIGKGTLRAKPLRGTLVDSDPAMCQKAKRLA